MKWSMSNEDNHKPKLCGIEQCKLPYFACIQSIFPRTPTFQLEEINDNGDLDFKGWDEDPPTSFAVDNVDNQLYTDQTNIGTQQIGGGDSGTGHWMYNDAGVAVLVGITTMGTLAGRSSVMQKTTNREILEFINDNIGVPIIWPPQV
jgi:hypothetical protein